MASILTVDRGTTYGITHNYYKNGVLSTDGQTLFFTVKASESDLDNTDAAALVLKNVAMSGGTNAIIINPVDTQNVAPGKYWYDLKVLDSTGAIYRVDKGRFVLDASPTNRLAP